jgi:hypothetical protein
MANIVGSVGRGGKNNRPDVKVVQQLINANLPQGIVRLVEDGLIGPKTLVAIVEFQRQKVPSLALAPSGVIAPGDVTWQRLNSARSPQSPQGDGPEKHGMGVDIPKHGMGVDIPKHGMGVDIPIAKAWPAKFTFEQFIRFTESLEGGAIDHMFMVQDKQVATGYGITFTGKANRELGLAQAKALHWFFKPGHARAGRPCDPVDVEKDYDAVLGAPGRLSDTNGHLAEFAAMTSCRISRQTLENAARRKIASNLNTVRLRRDAGAVGDFDNFPVDAQLCIASLTWAVGPNFGMVPKFKEFCAACQVHDFALAEQKCAFDSQVNTLPLRHRHQQTMMHNAELVERGQGDRDTLYWPTRLVRGHVPIL